MKNLKKSALMICLFAFAQLFAQNTPEVQFETMHTETPEAELQYEYLMAHKVFLRAKPSVKGKKIGILNIGTPMVLWEKSKNTEQLNGIKSNWYRVTAGTQTGWVWGGMIAQKAFGSEADYRVKFVYGLEASSINEHGIAENRYQLRAFKNGHQLDKIVLDSLVSTPCAVENIGNKGLFNVEDIIKLDVADKHTGANIGKSYVFWNNGKFTNIANLMDYSDAFYTKTESFVFPSDMEGTRSTVALKTVIVDNNMVPESGLLASQKRHITTAYGWNGYKLSKKGDDHGVSNTSVASTN